MNNEEYRKQLIRKFHVLLREANVNEENKMVLLASYGVESSKDMTIVQLCGICSFLQGQISPELANKDKQRKKLLAAVCGFCESKGVKGWDMMPDDVKMEYAKGVACRAAHVESFNKISMDKMKRLTYSFKNQKEEMDSVVRLALEAMRI